MNAIIPRGSRLGQQALSSSFCYSSKSLLRCLRITSLRNRLVHGTEFNEGCPPPKRGLRRLSASRQQTNSKYPPPRREIPDIAKQEEKKPVFNQGNLRFYATCHPGTSLPMHASACATPAGTSVYGRAENARFCLKVWAYLQAWSKSLPENWLRNTLEPLAYSQARLEYTSGRALIRVCRQ